MTCKEAIEQIPSLNFPAAINLACQKFKDHGFGTYFFSVGELSDQDKRDLERTASIIKEGRQLHEIDVDTVLRLAWVDYKLENFDTCLEELTQVIQRVPENDKNHRIALNCKVLLCLKLSKIPEAEDAMKNYFKLIDTAGVGA